jgi:uracil-DNA glycosylase
MTVTDWDPLHGADWESLLRQEFEREYWDDLQAFVAEERSRHDVYPPRDEVFAALRLTPCTKTRVVIVGQDPHPRAGQANGLAFAVPRGVQVPPSLANIHRELHDDLGVPTPDHGSLEPWARRGVLLLNAALLVRAEAPRSHQRIWKTFTDAVIRVVAEETDPVFILWGKDAQEKAKALIDASQRRSSSRRTLRPRSARRGFFGSKPFSRANHALIVAGREEVDSRLA